MGTPTKDDQDNELIFAQLRAHVCACSWWGGDVGTIGRTHVLSLSVTTTAGSGGETGREASAAHLRIGSYVISAQNG